MIAKFIALSLMVWTALAFAPGVDAGVQTAASMDERAEATERIDLNRATAKELTKLPGVGEKVAERIIAYRDEHGPFESPEEIMNVRGIGEKTYLKLEPLLTVDEKTSSQ